MRISVVILVVAGIAAALAAGVAVTALSAQSWNMNRVMAPKSPDMTVLVARTALPALTVITEQAIETKSLSRDKAPANALVDPLQAVGKMLVMPLQQGEPMTAGSFAADGSRLQLASKVAPGLRAVSVNVSDAGALHGFLFPGSTVDVLVAIKRSQSEDVPDSISTTLLENILVMGVEDESVVNPQGDKKDDANSGAAQARVRKVTLMVDMQQAKALQLAQDVGVISLAMRKPGDATKNTESTPVSLRQIAGLPAPVNSPPPPERVVASATGTAPTIGADVPTPRQYEQWPVTIIRGSSLETRTYSMPGGH
jgi:pilus assembly protein CpaB